MAEYGRLVYAKGHEVPLDKLKADYLAVTRHRPSEFSAMEVVDLGPIDGFPDMHAWGWRADGPDPKEW